MILLFPAPAIWGIGQTHNIEFLKYLKRVSKPQNSVSYFLVERVDSKVSTIKPMPKYLQRYQTEFTYLFEQIFRCSMKSSEAEDYTLYNFGNNARKFLEAFLYFKYPHSEKEYEVGLSELVFKYFDLRPESTFRLLRAVNELSHRGKNFEGAMKPLELSELPLVATYIMQTMCDKDRDQFECLLKSIGKSESISEFE